MSQSTPYLTKPLPFSSKYVHVASVFLLSHTPSSLRHPPDWQDAYCLAQRLAALNRGSAYDGSLIAALQDYERARKPDTALVLAKSVFVGAVETLGGATGGGVVGELFRNNFFFGMWKGGVAEQIFMDGAMPKV